MQYFWEYKIKVYRNLKTFNLLLLYLQMFWIWQEIKFQQCSLCSNEKQSPVDFL